MYSDCSVLVCALREHGTLQVPPAPPPCSMRSQFSAPTCTRPRADVLTCEWQNGTMSKVECVGIESESGVAYNNTHRTDHSYLVIIGAFGLILEHLKRTGGGEGRGVSDGVERGVGRGGRG